MILLYPIFILAFAIGCTCLLGIAYKLYTLCPWLPGFILFIFALLIILGGLSGGLVR